MWHLAPTLCWLSMANMAAGNMAAETMLGADGRRHMALLRMRKPLLMRPRPVHATIIALQMPRGIRRLPTYTPTVSG